MRVKVQCENNDRNYAKRDANCFAHVHYYFVPCVYLLSYVFKYPQLPTYPYHTQSYNLPPECAATTCVRNAATPPNT